MLASRNSAESARDFLIVIKLWLIVSGIYIWEFVSTLDFEWSVIRRHRCYRWTIWIYSVSRLSGLAVIIIFLINLYEESPINCQASVTSSWAFSALGGYGLSSILIMLRIFAIWDKSKVIMAISAAIWMINLGFQLAGIVKIRGEWVPATKSCTITNVEICRNFYINLLVTDVILLFIMLAGLLRLRLGARGSFYLSHLLWKQGVIWLAIATAAELPQTLFLFLHVNDSFNILFLMPSMVTIIIAATRTYRSLVHSASPDVATSISSNRLEVTVHRACYEEYPMSQMNHYGSYTSSDVQLTNKPHELGSDDNIEARDEKERVALTQPLRKLTSA